MIQVILGKKGTGKTKKIIQMANDTLKSATGDIVFIDHDKQYMYDLKHNIRFIDASEYEIESPKMFFGFLCGIAANNFDLEYLFIDKFLKIVKHDLSELEGLFEHLSTFSERCKVNIIMSISTDPEQIPEYLKSYSVVK